VQPAIAVQPAVPVEPLSYGTPIPHIPGILTAIGVISIVLGSWGVLSGGCGAMYGVIFGMMSARMPALPPPPTASVLVAPATGVVAGPAGPDGAATAGLDPARRELALSAMTSAHAISSQRSALLESLLAKAGDQILVIDSPQMPQAEVDAQISESGRTTGGLSDDAAADYYVTGSGRVQIDDNAAVFQPSSGGPAVRITAADLPLEGDWQSGLLPEQVDAVLARIEELQNRPLAPAQRTALQAVLTDPSSGMVIPSPTIAGAAEQVRHVYDYGRQSIAIGFQDSQVAVDSAGTILSSYSYRRVPAPTAPTAATPAMPKFSSAFAMVAVISAIGSLLSLALAVLLLTAGILMLRRSMLARQLHLIYAWIKIPLTLLSAVAWAIVYVEFVSGLTGGWTTPPPPRTSWTLGLMMGAGVLLGCIYPVALLIALRSRTVRAYYGH
jgi:hypothetical protein